MPLIKIDFPQRWILPIALFFFLSLLIIIELPMLNFANGLLIYPQDDGYIRLAIARNLVNTGVWGLSPHEFSNASSSILYPVLLAACFKIFGPQTIIPLFFNLTAATGFIITLQQWLEKQALTPFQQLLVLLMIIYVTPLHIMVLDGMEHTLQIWLSLLFVLKFTGWIGREKGVDGKSPMMPKRLYLYALLITAIRYEGLFFVGVACALLLLRRKWVTSTLLLLAGLPSVVLFGIYSLAHGGYFIPNSILVKAVPLPLTVDTFVSLFKDGIVNKLLYPYPSMGAVAANRMLILLPLACSFYFSSLQKKENYRYILYFLLASTILHLVFANANLYYRYEAYLVACGLVVPVALMAKYGIPLFMKNTAIRCIATWTIFFLIYPFFSRSWAASQEVENGFLHEYECNYQAASFLHRYYDDATVVMDELGLASFLSRGRKLDLVTGIAYIEITRIRVEGSTPVGYLNYLANKEKPVIALIAENKYHPLLRQGWIKVAAWYTDIKLPFGESELDFYAVDPAAVSPLRANLKTFQSSMPVGIRVNYF